MVSRPFGATGQWIRASGLLYRPDDTRSALPESVRKEVPSTRSCRSRRRPFGSSNGAGAKKRTRMPQGLEFCGLEESVSAAALEGLEQLPPNWDSARRPEPGHRAGALCGGVSTARPCRVTAPAFPDAPDLVLSAAPSVARGAHGPARRIFETGSEPRDRSSNGAPTGYETPCCRRTTARWPSEFPSP